MVQVQTQSLHIANKCTVYLPHAKCTYKKREHAKKLMTQVMKHKPKVRLLELFWDFSFKYIFKGAALMRCLGKKMKSKSPYTITLNHVSLSQSMLTCIHVGCFEGKTTKQTFA